MRVPLDWLRDYCPTTLGAEQLAELLTNHGVEVERILRPWEEVRGVLVARVLEVRDHPDADKLCLARIDTGAGERDVVVGVRNMGPGDLVPYAPPGATLPGLPTLERREIRGVASDGMLCSPKELGISADHSGILVMDGLEPGGDLAEALALHDPVLDIEVRPNRPDTMSVVGVAREVAAVTVDDLRIPNTSVEEDRDPAEEAATLEVSDGERCPQYVARIIRGVGRGATPLRAQVRLAAAGMRPLAAVVDATNYAMLELGQPMHPFDLDRLAGPAIVVRTAGADERLVTLDDVERALTEEDLLICDAERPVAVAGVMGGASSEVSEATRDVLLESARFQPVSIFRTARRLDVRTEASARFERGVDPEGVAPAAARAAALIAGWTGGRVLAGALEAGGVPERKAVGLRPSRAGALLGVEVSGQEVREALGRLRLPVTGEDEDLVTVEVPGYRVDLEREADLVEEVGRAIGYERIPSALPGIRQAGGLSTDQRLRRRVRDVLAGLGAFEVVSPSFVPATDAELFEDERNASVRLANPVSAEESSLRTSLLPGLLRAARRNVSFHRTSVRLFEVGRTFLGRGTDVEEIERVAVLLAGPAGEEWPAERRPMDYLDARGVLEQLLGALGLEGWELSQIAFPPFHPARCTELVLPGQPPAGEVAEVHPGVAGRFDLSGRVAVLELRTAALVSAALDQVTYRTVSRFPPVRRDLAFLVDRDVPAGAVRAALVDAAGELLDRVLLMDVYEGKPLPPGKKNLAFSIDLRSLDRTLTDQEAVERVRLIAGRLAADFDAELREG